MRETLHCASHVTDSGHSRAIHGFVDIDEKNRYFLILRPRDNGTE